MVSACVRGRLPPSQRSRPPGFAGRAARFGHRAPRRGRRSGRARSDRGRPWRSSAFSSAPSVRSSRNSVSCSSWLSGPKSWPTLSVAGKLTPRKSTTSRCPSCIALRSGLGGIEREQLVGVRARLPELHKLLRRARDRPADAGTGWSSRVGGASPTPASVPAREPGAVQPCPYLRRARASNGSAAEGLHHFGHRRVGVRPSRSASRRSPTQVTAVAPLPASITAERGFIASVTARDCGHRRAADRPSSAPAARVAL